MAILKRHLAESSIGRLQISCYINYYIDAGTQITEELDGVPRDINDAKILLVKTLKHDKSLAVYICFAFITVLLALLSFISCTTNKGLMHTAIGITQKVGLITNCCSFFRNDCNCKF